MGFFRVEFFDDGYNIRYTNINILEDIIRLRGASRGGDTIIHKYFTVTSEQIVKYVSFFLEVRDEGTVIEDRGYISVCFIIDKPFIRRPENF